jgi:cytochrome c oxidase subunit 3
VATDSRALTTHDDRPIGGRAHDTSGGISNPILGMLLFLTSEVMFFAGLFAAYFNLRANIPNWGEYVDAAGVTHHFAEMLAPLPFTTESGALNLILPATIILVISSFTCQFGVWAIRNDDRTGLVRNIGVTLILGILFLLIQAYDYSVLYSEHLTLGSGPFGTTYFTLTGFHGAHVFGGVIMLAVVLYRSMAGQFTGRHHDMVEATSLYWHFVDVVWILLFSILYIL